MGQTLNGIFQAVFGIGPALIFHAFEGVVLLVVGVLIVALALRTRTESVKIVAILGLVMVVSSGLGGILFVLSGFQANGSSIQMGGSFIGAYAFYFLVLYFSLCYTFQNSLPRH